MTHEEIPLVEEDFLNDSLPSKLNQRESDINHTKQLSRENYATQDDQYDEESFEESAHMIDKNKKPEVETRTSMKG